jgi:colanic acid biosynthesis glycosyl transferase WcaI
MKILIISAVFPPEIAAAGFMSEELAEELKLNGHKVLIITGWPSYPEGHLFKDWNAKFHKVVKNENNLKIIRVGHTFGNRKNTLLRFFYFLSFSFSSFVVGLFSGSIDKVICLSTPIFGTWSSWMLAKIKWATFFYDVFDLHPESAFNAGLLNKESPIYKIWYFQDRLLCKKSDIIVTLSNAMKNEIAQRGINIKKIHTIPFWIDTDRIMPKNRINNWRIKNNIQSDTFVALYAGTIGYISGVEILIEVSDLLKVNSKILILLVGEGVLKENLMEKAVITGCKNIRFLPFQSESDLSNMLASADVGLITLLENAGRTSVPSKMLGYMAAERPVIASVSNDSGTAELINEGKCGIIAGCQNAQSIAEAILFAIENPEKMEVMGKRGRQLIQNKYSRKVCAAQYESLLQQN